ncbi:MAG: sodium:solute symporter family protein [Bacteroidota bacterium]|jgi:SSS family solute:Na+ symporter/sodium/proline symporter|nr:sodium:solute symporter family protein [Bacteroidota bacterium]
MYTYIVIIVAYLIALTVYNFIQARKVKTQDDMMVAGRSLGVTKMVFTLVCTWIGSGTFIAGAEYAYRAGWSSMWMPAGAWVGIAIIYFLAGKIRTFGQYTIGDILEERYGKFARLFGAIALIIAFTTIVSYQFRAGGYILNVITDGAVSVEMGQALAAGFVILFTAIGGMIAVAHTDLPNGIIIVLACIVSVPFVVATAGGLGAPAETLPASHMLLVSPDFGQYPFLKAFSYFLATMFLLLGVQSMYQKFYSAKTPADAKKAVALWIVGTIVVETVVVVIAIYASSYYWGNTSIDPAAVVLHAAREMVPAPVGLLLLAAAVVVVLSTGMNYLLSPSTNIMRDIYQRFIAPDAPQSRMVALQKVLIVVLGLVAFLLIFIPTVMKSEISVLKYAYFAYTIYGVAITPALLAALAWKRATKAGGLTSILSGAFMVIALDIVLPYALPQVMIGGDPWGLPSIYPALAVSIGTLVIVSYMTPKPDRALLAKLFPEGNG